jgi:hypothetical protein
MIDVTQDAQGVSQAIGELLEEAFFQHLVGPSLARADEESSIHLLSSGPVRGLSPAYYKWGSYLLSLEEVRDCGVEIHNLLAFEVAGLVQVRRARAAFDSRHPLCGCGQRLESRYVPECDGCGVTFRKAG